MRENVWRNCLMILRWHINVYWYIILIMFIFLIFLMLPDKVSFSKSKSTYESKMNKLADDGSKAITKADRAKISRRLLTIEKEKENKSSNNTFSLIPLKYIMVALMGLFTYLVFLNIWKRRKMQVPT
jgi:hypothetical protein